jgi:hypothetical protein
LAPVLLVDVLVGACGYEDFESFRAMNASMLARIS